MGGGTGATARLGRFVSGCATRELSPASLEKAAVCLIDGFGLGIIARDERTSRAYREVVTPLDGRAHTARIWADGTPVSVAEAVCANAIAAHGHFHDDSEYSSWTHPGSLIIPAAVSLGEATGADVGQVLRAIVSGYASVNWLGAEEEVARALIGRGVRTSPTLGRIGAAATAATLLGLDERQATNAIGIATSITGGLLEPVRTGSDEWRLQNAHAAQGGLLAAQMAARGVVGAPTALEGPKGLLAAYAALDEVPARWQSDPDPDSIVTHVVAKPYATLGDNMAAAIASKLLYDNGVDIGAIRSIRITLWRHYAEYPGTDFRGPFTETAQALASTVFAVAAMLVHGQLEFDINRDHREDPDILRLAELSAIEPDDIGGPEDSVVEITFADGRTMSRSSREAPRTLLYHDRPTSEALAEERLVRMGWKAGSGTEFARAVFAEADTQKATTLKAVLDRLYPG